MFLGTGNICLCKFVWILWSVGCSLQTNMELERSTRYGRCFSLWWRLILVTTKRRRTKSRERILFRRNVENIAKISMFWSNCSGIYIQILAFCICWQSKREESACISIAAVSLNRDVIRWSSSVTFWHRSRTVEIRLVRFTHRPHLDSWLCLCRRSASLIEKNLEQKTLHVLDHRVFNF